MTSTPTRRRRGRGGPGCSPPAWPQRSSDCAGPSAGPRSPSPGLEDLLETAQGAAIGAHDMAVDAHEETLAGDWDRATSSLANLPRASPS